MCNLYNITTSHEAACQLFKFDHNHVVDWGFPFSDSTQRSDMATPPRARTTRRMVGRIVDRYRDQAKTDKVH